ncbi:MAG: MBL fold metallo-hydrolase [Micropepsaceae bacterium]
MRWLRGIGIVLVALLALGGAGYWYYVLDGAVPATSNYRTDIAGWRALVVGDAVQLPTSIRIEFVGRDAMPFAAVQGGGANVDFARARVAFQLEGPSGTVIIDSTMEKDIAAKAQRPEKAQFDEAAYGRVIAAMGVAARVAVTHEHPDHMGGVARFPVPERLAERLTLSRPQLAGMGMSTVDGKIPEAFSKAQIIDLVAPVRIAPGVVMIPAPGHTPGSAMFYVRFSNGHEALFIGDIAWAISNITTPATRPRFIQQFFLKNEDRAAVSNQVRALHDLGAAEPALTIIPSHDARYFDELIAKGLLIQGFVVEAP